MNKSDKDLKDFKNEYMNIKPSEDFIMKMNKEVKKEKTKRNFRVSTTVAAAFIVIAGVSLNASPALANALSDVPVISTIVKVVTFGKYEVADQGYELSVNTPKIEGLVNKELEEKLNKEFKEQADSVKAMFESDVEDLKAEFGEETVHMGLEFDYQVKTDTDEILALDVYTYFASGSSTSVHKYYTLNKKTGEIYTLKGMFKEGSDYITPITGYIKTEMERLNKDDGGMFFIEDFDKIVENQKFYLNDKGEIVICFDKYEVAAGAQGTPEFVIPQLVIADIKA